MAASKLDFLYGRVLLGCVQNKSTMVTDNLSAMLSIVERELLKCQKMVKYLEAPGVLDVLQDNINDALLSLS